MRAVDAARWLVLLAFVACADAQPRGTQEDGEPLPDVGRIVCEADGQTSVPTPRVLAQPDGVHLVIDSRLDEPASIGGFGFDVDPGVSEWVLQIGPGDRAFGCWPFSEHGSGDEPETVPLEVLDPGGMFVGPVELECPGDEQWTSVLDFIELSSGIAADPVEAVRRSVTGLEPGDDVSVHRSGYPESDDEGGATVVVRRDGNAIAIFGATLADDGRWLLSGGQGCASTAVDFG